MKLDKEKLEALAALDDAHLWAEIRAVAKKFGYTLPESAPDAKDMARIRAAMRSADKISPMDAARLISAIKAKARKE